MKEEKRISYRAGITRKPSDFLCEDGELEECINLTTDGEELKVVTDARNLFGGTALSGRLLFVHNLPDGGKNYICETGSASAYSLVYYHADTGGNIGSQQSFPEDTTTHGTSLGKQQITAIGKTVIVATDKGLKHFVWESAYKYIGDNIPAPDVRFKLKGYHTAPGGASSVNRPIENSTAMTGILDSDTWKIKDDKQEDYNNAVVGVYRKNLLQIARKKAFSRPFFLRTALKLFDGSYTHISQPILMFPAVRANSFMTINPSKLTLYTYYANLLYKSNTSYQDWSDLVSSVVVFMSSEIELYDTIVDQTVPQFFKADDLQHDWICDTGDGHSKYYRFENGIENTGNISQDRERQKRIPLKLREEREIIAEIESTSIFYKLCEIGLDGVSNYSPMDGLFDVHTLENIVVQDQLKYDDYYSFCPMVANYLYAYNSRLNIASASRGFFEGFHSFMPYGTQEGDITIIVKIEVPGEDRYVKTVVKGTEEMIGWWFFYPDPRAKAVDISVNGGYHFYHTLKECPGLHGAYCFCGLPTQTNQNPSFANEGSPLTYPGDPTPEPLNSYIIQSEVNNPWVFRSEGYHMVGDGNILAVSTQTVALSQGQFGTYPLIVFTDEGLWGLSVKATGIYGNGDPFSREVCINADSVVQTDGAVYFVSKKGLMRIVGSQVVCVTEQMQGKVRNTIDLSIPDTSPDYEDENLHEFNDMLHRCEESVGFCKFLESSSLIMAYDYVDSRILITCASEAVSPLGWAYVYSLKDGSVSRVEDAKAIKCAVTDYPDTLLQAQDGKVYSLYEKAREEDVSGRKIGLLLTRPMKFGGPLTVSSLREVVNVGEWDEPGSWVRMRVWLSDDLKTWYESTSRYGAAAMYLRIALYMKLKATERVSGSIVRYESRRDYSFRKC